MAGGRVSRAARDVVGRGATYLMPTDGVNLVIYYAKAPFDKLGLRLWEGNTLSIWVHLAVGSPAPEG
jgi:hypothetical protein